MHNTAANDTLLWLYFVKDTVLSVYTEFNAVKLIYGKDL